MIKRSAGILVVGLLLVSMTGAQGDKRVFNTENVLPLPEELQAEPQVKEVSGYRQWARIAPEPQPVIQSSVVRVRFITAGTRDHTEALMLLNALHASSRALCVCGR